MWKKIPKVENITNIDAKVDREEGRRKEAKEFSEITGASGVVNRFSQGTTETR
jgi:hypothetical protein